MLQKGFPSSLALICIISIRAFSQKSGCISGKINSFSDHGAIPFAVILLKETGQQKQSDSLGNFEFCGLTFGLKTLLIKQLGYDSASFSIQPGKKRQVFHLRETGQLLDVIDIVGRHKHFESEVVEAEVIHKVELERSRGISLGELTRKIPGVSALQTGPTLFKPVIQGLTGQRIAIVNNGSKMEGQQWGFDHAPEIDPNGANEIIVIKGAQAVRYGAEAIGGVILVEPGEVGSKSLSGRINSGYSTNGKGGFVGLSLEKSHGQIHRFAWRINLNRKESGDFNTAKYVLGNTAMQEWSTSALARHQFQNWKSELYFNYFATRIGIFKGSHISSPEGIRLALNRPDSTYRYGFSYEIDRPYQNIHHILAKAKAEYSWSENTSSQIIFNQQTDHREEYDLQRISQNGCNSCPQLLFTLTSNQLEINHQLKKEKYNVRLGLVGFTHANVVERAILIPNFRVYQCSIYSIQTWYREKWTFETGARIETRQQQIFRYVGQNFENPKRLFLNYMLNAGAKYDLHDHWHARLNFQVSKRAPNVNELYSNGVHHGTASFEKGDENLKPEQIWNASFSVHHKSEKWQALINLFETYSPNFIYLTPLKDTIVTTIRGPFPLFQYRESEVNLKGLDYFVEYAIHKNWSVFSKGAMVRSWNFSDNDYLIFQPADRIEAGIRFTKLWKETGFSLSWDLFPAWIKRQFRAPENVDLAPAPDGYFLWNSQLAIRKEKGKFRFDISLEGRNLTNETYRDYMNRFRYYAYDLGRNWVVRLNVPFGN